MKHCKIILCLILPLVMAAELDFNDEDSTLLSELGEAEFTWIRGIYSSNPIGSRFYPGEGSGWWETDFDDSDRNFLRGVQRYTAVNTNSRAYKPLALTDPELFEYTFLYMNIKRVPLIPGIGPDFSEEEAAALREFMLRGGFVVFDDFWGESHWEDFLVEYIKIFPDRPLIELSTDHPIFHTFFDIDSISQVPGRAVTWDYSTGFDLDDPDYPPSVHAVVDDNNRVMMVVNHNTDLGDGWEHTFYEPYPTRYCNDAYKLGINYIIYALSH